MNVLTKLDRDVSDEVTIYQEVNNKGQKYQSSNFSSNFNASDSNGESVKHRWNYASYYPKIRHISKEWTIAILLKLLLVSWDVWTHHIGYKRRMHKFKNVTIPREM